MKARNEGNRQVSIMTTQPSQLNDRDLELLSSYIDGQLSVDERREIERRLRAETPLSLAYDDLRATVQALRDLEPVRPPRSFTLDPAVVAPPPQPAARWNLGRLLQVAGVFAAVLVAAIGTLSVLGGSMGAGAPVQQAASESAPAAAPMVAAAPTLAPMLTEAPLMAEAPMAAAEAPMATPDPLAQARESAPAALEAPMEAAPEAADMAGGAAEPAAEMTENADVAASAMTPEALALATPEAALAPANAPEQAPAQPPAASEVREAPAGADLTTLIMIAVAVLLAGGAALLWRRGRSSR